MANYKPIDLVVPMVFMDDEAWQKRYMASCAKVGISCNINERVRNWGTEKYFFRGIAKFMPWVRTIHLILESETQIPKWLNTENVHIVYHRDIMPTELLPTYNSQSMEMWLHRIEGLAEQFIYCNDDMIACSPLKRTDFFQKGLPVIHCGEKHYDSLGGIFRTVCRNTLDMVAKDAGKSFDDGVLLKDGHSYAPMLVSTLNEAVDKYGKRMKESCSTFRESKNFIQYLYTYMQWLNCKCIDGHHAHKYFDTASDINKVTDTIRSGKAGVICFNDNDKGDWRAMSTAVVKELDTIMPEKCKYEK